MRLPLAVLAVAALCAYPLTAIAQVKTVLLIGDSNSSYTMSPRASQGNVAIPWGRLLERKLGLGWNVHTVAQPGSTVRNWTPPGRIFDFQAAPILQTGIVDVVHIMLTLDDAEGQPDADEFAWRMTALISRVLIYVPHVILTEPPHRLVYENIPTDEALALLGEYREVVRQLCADPSWPVTCGPRLGELWAALPGWWIGPDGDHLTQFGSESLSSEIANRIRVLLLPDSPPWRWPAKAAPRRRGR